jgi:hypothetical protein
MRSGARGKRGRSLLFCQSSDNSQARPHRMMVTLMAIAALILSGCEPNSPHGVAYRYLEDLHRSNYAGCYAMLADQDRKDRTLAEFLTEMPLAPDVGPAIFHIVLQTIQFDLGEVNRDGDNAFLPVKVTAPNLPLWERALDAAAGPDQAGGANAKRSLAASDFPKIAYNDGIFLIREHGHWRVIADFTDRDRIVDRHREAVVEYHQYDYAKVIADYKSMIAELERLKFTGASGLAARYRSELAVVQTAKVDAPAAAAYAAKSLTLSDIAMRMSEERVPAIFGSIANVGTRALDAVQITVTWYEGRRNSLKVAYAEKHPIVITPIEFTDFSVPVLPYVPGEKRRFGFILTAPVQVQQDAAPYLTISTVAFTYLKAPLPKLASSGNSKTPSASVAAHLPPPAIAVPKPTGPPSSAPRPRLIPRP